MDEEHRATRFMNQLRGRSGDVRLNTASLIASGHRSPDIPRQYLHPSRTHRGIQWAIGVFKSSWHVQLQIRPHEGCASDAFDFLVGKASEIEQAAGPRHDWKKWRQDRQRRNITWSGRGGYTQPSKEWPQTHSNMTDAFQRLTAAVGPFLDHAAARGGSSRLG